MKTAGRRGLGSAVAAIVGVLLSMPSLPARAAPGATVDQRAVHLVAAMTLDEKVALLHTAFGTPRDGHPPPRQALDSAGFNPGLPRLGIPPLEESDAGLGIANPTNASFDATAMPSTLALGAAFDPVLAHDAGATIGEEARAMGFSVLLGGGANIVREPRGGRDFEYVSEDPLLTGTIAGAEIAGVQSRHVVSTMKHFALNAQENGRIVYDARLAEAPAREADLLAFEIALERGKPGAVMAAYNRVDGVYASQNPHLLTDILKGDWRFPGWVMADWGGTHSTVAAANAGLDQESGEEDDFAVYFGASLKAAVVAGQVPMARLDDMVVRLLRAQIAAGGLDDPPRPGGPIDFAAHGDVARTVAGRGIVLLKNDGDVLPLGRGTRRLLLVGGHADIGVLSGGGSSQVAPRGSTRFEGVPAKLFYGKPRLLDPSPPLAALRDALPGTVVTFDDGHDRAATAAAARQADAVVVFATRWANESLDLPDLRLPFDQDALIAGVASANPRTVVVLETSGGVTMPWLSSVPAVLEAWYPGGRGGEAIADVLTGAVDPSGHLPVTFPAGEAELPRPVLPAHGKAASPKEAASQPPFIVDYDIEGADVGYKWYLRTRRKPLFPFGHGLCYTRFAVSGLSAAARAGTIAVAFDVTNTGARNGIDTAQIYLDGGAFTRRLGGWGHVALAPGETRHVATSIDPRLLASYDVATHGWHVAPGRYTVAVRPDALADGPVAEVTLAERRFPARHGSCAAGPCVGTAPVARADIAKPAATYPRAEPGRASATPRAAAP